MNFRDVTERDRRVCAGKEHHASRVSAEAQASRYANLYDKPPGRPYICPVCGLWAVATQAGVKKRPKKKKVKARVVKTHRQPRRHVDPDAV